MRFCCKNEDFCNPSYIEKNFQVNVTLSQDYEYDDYEAEEENGENETWNGSTEFLKFHSIFGEPKCSILSAGFNWTSTRVNYFWKRLEGPNI